MVLVIIEISTMKLTTINKKTNKTRRFCFATPQQRPLSSAANLQQAKIRHGRQLHVCSNEIFGVEGCCTSAATKYLAWKAAASLRLAKIRRGWLLHVCG